MALRPKRINLFLETGVSGEQGPQSTHSGIFHTPLLCLVPDKSTQLANIRNSFVVSI
jgi:hypothetical protein